MAAPFYVLWPHASPAPSSLQLPGIAFQKAVLRACNQHTSMDAPQPPHSNSSQGTVSMTSWLTTSSSSLCSRTLGWPPTKLSPHVQLQEHPHYRQFAKKPKLYFPPQYDTLLPSLPTTNPLLPPQPQSGPPIKHRHSVKLCTVSISNSWGENSVQEVPKAWSPEGDTQNTGLCANTTSSLDIVATVAGGQG